MPLCDKVNNLTLIAILNNSGRLAFINEQTNQLDGILGKRLNSVTGNLGRGCRFVEAKLFGTQSKNLTYDGALQLLQSETGDMIINKHVDHYGHLQIPFLRQSPINYLDTLSLIQKIKPTKYASNFLMNIDASFLVLNQIVFLTFVISFVLFLWLFTRKKCNELKKKIFKNALSLFLKLKSDYHHRAFTIIGFILFFMHLFDFLTIQILINAIRVSKVIVDLSSISKSLQDVIDSNSTACFFNDYLVWESLEAKKSIKSSVLDRLYEKTIISASRLNAEVPKRCILAFTRLDQPIDLTNRIVFLSRSYANFFLTNYVTKTKGSKIFISDPVLEAIMVNYYRKGLNEIQRRAIENYAKVKFENALNFYVYRSDSVKCAPEWFEIYYDFKTFIETNTIFNSLDQKFFAPIFKLYFILTIFILIMFFVSKFILTIKRIIRIWKRRSNVITN